MLSCWDAAVPADDDDNDDDDPGPVNAFVDFVVVDVAVGETRVRRLVLMGLNRRWQSWTGRGCMAEIPARMRRMCSCWVGGMLAKRRHSCIVIDTMGVGEVDGSGEGVRSFAQRDQIV